MKTATDLIDRSISHTDTVTVAYSADLADDLRDACDDSVSNGDVVEFWGTASDGEGWRVHLRRQTQD